MVKGRLRTLFSESQILTRVAYLDGGAMREFETWDKREVVTPTSFILNLKQLAETWEFNRLILVWQSILK